LLPATKHDASEAIETDRIATSSSGIYTIRFSLKL
jgi:hypothetical protein